MKTALTIAGSDPTGGAGLQADLRVFGALGISGLSVPTVLTAQNTEGVSRIYELPPDFFKSQINTLLEDIRPDALKTGMLYSADIIGEISSAVTRYALRNLVIDPVTVSSTGVQLIKDRGLEAMKEKLFPLAKVITPNIYEAGIFTGREIVDVDDMKDAARRLRDLGSETVIVTGGHLSGEAVDLLFDGEDFMSLEKERLDGEFHGTGCVFSAAITSYLALGNSVEESFIKASAFVHDAMQAARSMGRGMKILGV